MISIALTASQYFAKSKTENYSVSEIIGFECLFDLGGTDFPPQKLGERKKSSNWEFWHSPHFDFQLSNARFGTLALLAILIFFCALFSFA